LERETSLISIERYEDLDNGRHTTEGVGRE